MAAIGVVLRRTSVPAVEGAAVRFQDQAAYNATVLSGARVAHPTALAPAEPAGVTVDPWPPARARPWARLALAFFALYWRRLPCCAGDSSRAQGWRSPLRRLQSGVINDYVTWIVVGLACLGGALALAIR